MKAACSLLKELSCTEAGEVFSPHQVQTYCAACASPILARYDLLEARKYIDPGKITARPKGIWRWAELFAVFDQEKLAAAEGILITPEGAAAFAAFRRLKNSKWIQPQEREVIFNTVSDLKYL